MKRLLPLVLVLGWAVAAHAGDDYRFTSSTLARGLSRPGVSEDTVHFPFYEFVTLQSRDVGVEGIDIHASMWGRITAGDVHGLDAWRPNDRISGDVNVLQVTYRAPEETLLEGLVLRGGRQFVAVGPSMYDQFDGGYASYRLPVGFDLSAFGGVVTGVRFVQQPWPIDEDDATFGPNWTAGGRLGYSFQDWVRVGVGYRQKRYAGRMAFNEIAWDLISQPLGELELLTDGVTELTAGRLKEARVSARYQINREINTGLGYRYTAPDLFVPRSSIFAVFSNEERQEILAEAVWSPLRWLTLQGEAGGLIFAGNCAAEGRADEICDGLTALPAARIRADLRYGPDKQHRGVFVFERNGARDGGFWRWRLATTLKLRYQASLVFDLDAVLLDDRSAAFTPATDRTDFAFSGSGYLARQVTDSVHIMVGGQGYLSPLYSHSGTFTVRLNWLMDGQAKKQASGQATAVPPVNVSRSSSQTFFGGLM